MKRIAILNLFFFISLFSFSSEPGNNIAFPNAEGCGKYTTGGRGGKVIYVTNLKDSGEGSLRHALKEVDGKKIILFKVSGTIFLKSQIDVRKGDFTLAGQSSPGDGICVAGDGVDISNTENMIIRYMRFRPGDIDNDETDALTIRRSKNVIVDHCSMTWSTDETCSCYDNTNFTLQWCIVSESLNNSVHHKGAHGYGGIWGGMNATFHHNLLSDHSSRNPRLQGSRYHHHPELEKTEFVNNVVYNWRMKCIYGGEQGIYAIAGNYFKPGPATGDHAKYILEPYKPFASFYFKNNFIEENPELTANNLLSVKKRYDEEQLKFDDEYPFQISDYKIEPAKEIYPEVLDHAGASIKRDSLDMRIIKEVRTGTFTYGQKGIIDTQDQVGDWPVLKSAPAPADSDNDGMPDTWEQSHQLNPNDASDGNKYTLTTNFTNIEVYLNSLCN